MFLDVISPELPSPSHPSFMGNAHWPEKVLVFHRRKPGIEGTLIWGNYWVVTDFPHTPPSPLEAKYFSYTQSGLCSSCWL